MAESALVASSPAPSAPPASHNYLVNAISSGSTEIVRQMITENPELVNMTGWHRQTALHRACLMGFIEIVRLLLEHGADPNARNNFEETPLHYACKRGLPPMLHCLVQAGADIDLVDKLGKGVIHHAADAGSVPIMHLLHCMYPDRCLDCQDNNLQTPLHIAIKSAKLEAFQYLMRKGRSKLKIADKDGNWPIHISAQEGYGYMTYSQLCILGRPALHVANKHGCTPYDLATMYDTAGHKELMRELKWQRGQDQGNVKQHAYLLWLLYLLLPFGSYTAALLLTSLIPAYHSVVIFLAIAYNVLVVSRTAHRLDHVCRWPQPFHAGLFGAGLFYTMLAYLVVIHPYMGSHPTLKLFTYVLAVVIVVLYVQVLTRDPGTLSSSAYDEKTGKSLSLLDMCTNEKWQMFCTQCEMIQPLQTKHCRLCDRCMLGMDHHCLFLLRCVAQDNHALFVWFVMLCLLCMGLFVYVCLTIYIFQVYPNLSWWDLGVEMLSRDAWVLSTFMLNCCSIAWATSLLAFQFNIISMGGTGYFQPKVVYPRQRLGVCSRLRNVMVFLMNKRRHVVSLTMSMAPGKTQLV